MGEEGYSLTTFQTVLAYLESLNVEQKLANRETKKQDPPGNEPPQEEEQPPSN